MKEKTYEPVKLTLEMHGIKHTMEGLDWDSSGEDLLDAFKRLLVGAGFSPSIMGDEFGRYEYVEYETPTI